jgi:hypothetical protein
LPALTAKSLQVLQRAQFFKQLDHLSVDELMKEQPEREEPADRYYDGEGRVLDSDNDKEDEMMTEAGVNAQQQQQQRSPFLVASSNKLRTLKLRMITGLSDDERFRLLTELGTRFPQLTELAVGFKESEGARNRDIINDNEDEDDEDNEMDESERKSVLALLRSWSTSLTNLSSLTFNCGRSLNQQEIDEIAVGFPKLSSLDCFVASAVSVFLFRSSFFYLA